MPDLAERLRRSFDPVPPVTLEDIRQRVDQRTPRRPHRLRTSLAIAFAGALVLATAIFVATRSTEAPRTPGATAATGGSWHIVSVGGVGLDVPSDWPVEDGARTGFCGAPFSAQPAVFIGPSYSGGMTCVAVPQSPRPSEGVWLQRSTVQASDLVPFTLPGGQKVATLRYPGSRAEMVVELFLHGVEVQVGEGKDPAVTARILSSLSYRRSRRDTQVPRPCALSPAPNEPTGPRVVTTTMRLDRGAGVLSPPEPGEIPVVTAATAFRNISVGPLDHAEILLGRFRYGAVRDPHTLRRIFHGQLAWVLYTQPNTPAVQGCGGWGFYAVDATTGQNSGLVGYLEGP